MQSSGSVSELERFHAGEARFRPSGQRFVAEISERSRDPVVAPVGVLTRHLDNQALYLRLNPGPPRVGPVLRAIELLPDQLPPPAENRLRFGHLRDLRQTLSPE